MHIFVGLTRELSIIVDEYLLYLERLVELLQLLRRTPTGLMLTETQEMCARIAINR